MLLLLLISFLAQGQPGKRAIPLRGEQPATTGGRFHNVALGIERGPTAAPTKPVERLYREHFDTLRHLELAVRTSFRASYAVCDSVLYKIRIAPDGSWTRDVLARLPFRCIACCLAGNGDLYLTSYGSAGRVSPLYRYDVARGRLYTANLELPPLDDYADFWISGAARGTAIYFLNKNGTQLVELAPGQPVRNLLAERYWAAGRPAFVGQVMNMTVSPAGAFLLKANQAPDLWVLRMRGGRLQEVDHRLLRYPNITGSLAMAGGEPEEPTAALYTGHYLGPGFGEVIRYELRTDTWRVVSSESFSDLAIRAFTGRERPWDPAGGNRLTGWFRGKLYHEQAEAGAFALHFRPDGRVDSAQLNGRAVGISWYYRTRDAAVDLSADPTFTDYLRWHGGGQRTGQSDSPTLALALQSSVPDALRQAGIGPLPFTYLASTELFALLTPAEPDPKSPPSPPPPVPPPPPPVVVQPAPVATPRKTPNVRVSDSLTCQGGDLLITVADFQAIDGDKVRFFIDDEAVTGVIKLRRRPRSFRVPCPAPGSLLVMKALTSGGKGACTALVTVGQGTDRKQFKLQAAANSASALRFWRR